MAKKILAIFGKAGSGKDTICRYIVNNCNVNKLVRITTRPKRQGETDGVEYFFHDAERLSERILDNAEQFLEIGVFNNWYYATPADQVKEGWNITTCDVDAVRQMINNYCDIEVYPVYVQVSDKTRLIRALNRETNPDVKEIIRRYQSDENDYRDIDFNYIELDNNGYFNPTSFLEILAKNNIDLEKWI